MLLLRFTAFCLLSLALWCHPTLGQSDFDQIEIETIRVAQGVYMLVGAGGNIGVSAGEDGVFLIDDQYAPLTEKVKRAIAAISSKPIRFVLNTHWHWDHTGGNENLGQAGVLIVAHDNVRVRMSIEQFVEAFNRTVPPSPEAALPVVTFYPGRCLRAAGGMGTSRQGAGRSLQQEDLYSARRSASMV